MSAWACLQCNGLWPSSPAIATVFWTNHSLCCLHRDLGPVFHARRGLFPSAVDLDGPAAGGGFGGDCGAVVHDGAADGRHGAPQPAPLGAHHRAEYRCPGHGGRHLEHAFRRHAGLSALCPEWLRSLDHAAVHLAGAAGLMAGAARDDARSDLRTPAVAVGRADGRGHRQHAFHRHGRVQPARHHALRAPGCVPGGGGERAAGCSRAGRALSPGIQRPASVAHAAGRLHHGLCHCRHALHGHGGHSLHRSAAGAGHGRLRHPSGPGGRTERLCAAAQPAGHRAECGPALPPVLPRHQTQRIPPARRGGYGGRRHHHDRRQWPDQLLQRGGRAPAGLDGAGGDRQERQHADAPAHAARARQLPAPPHRYRPLQHHWRGPRGDGPAQGRLSGRRAPGPGARPAAWHAAVRGFSDRYPQPQADGGSRAPQRKAAPHADQQSAGGDLPPPAGRGRLTAVSGRCGGVPVGLAGRRLPGPAHPFHRHRAP